jgi:hypothetical protein
MRRRISFKAARPVFTYAVVTAALAASGALAACGGGASDQAKVQSNFAREVTAIQQHDWQAWYALSSPRSRQDCKYADFLSKVQQGMAGSSVDSSKWGVRDVRAVVTGGSAALTYVATYDGKDQLTVTSDNAETWLKVDGKWYDDNKGKSACDTGN